MVLPEPPPALPAGGVCVCPPEDEPDPVPVSLPEDDPPVVSDGCCVDGSSVSGWACVLLPALA